MITITESAKRKLRAVIHKRGDDKALHLAIRGHGPEGFNYEFKLITMQEAHPGDVRVDEDGFSVYLDRDSLEQLEGSILDYSGLGSRGSFRVENPNPVWESPLGSKVHEVIVTQINPGIAAHGGYVTLVDVQGDDIYIEFGGGCMGCGASQVTLQLGIEKLIREQVPEVGQIIDATDHAAGTNPYYAPGAEGDSPLAE